MVVLKLDIGLCRDGENAFIVEREAIGDVLVVLYRSSLLKPEMPLIGSGVAVPDVTLMRLC
jgi:hypothetical protein